MAVTNDLQVQPMLDVNFPGATHVVMILDRSGSMMDRRSDVIGGFNSFIETCRTAAPGRCDVQFARFDNEVEPSVFRLPLDRVPAMDERFYAPRGGTALLDGVGCTVSAIESEADDRYIVIVFTDGEENASREWTKEKVGALLKEREALGNWTFAFFGAEIDAWSEAGGMGFSQGNAAAHSRADLQRTMTSAGRAASVMMQRGMSRSDALARTATAVNASASLSDEEIARLLADDDDAREPTSA